MLYNYKDKVFKGFVFSNLNIGSGYYSLSIDIGKTTVNPIPGQFLNFYLTNNSSIILPRPFTVFDFKCNSELGFTIQILYKVVGKGTCEISKIIKGDEVEFIFPLGNGFQVKGKRPLLIAGGTGIASLHYLSRVLQRDGIEFNFLAGVRNNNEYDSLRNVVDDTDVYWSIEKDAVKGIFQGNVVELYKSKSEIEHDEIFICGPTEMLKSFAKEFVNKNINAFCSLEARMGCGVGACLSCVVPAKYDYQLCCSDGPVFKISDILWKNIS